MRIDRRPPRLGSLSMRPRTAAVDASPFGDRARRFAWPARGTERVLGRDVQHSPGKGNAGRSRPGVGTRPGQTPYSCLVPPRYFSLLGKTTEEWNSEPRTIPAQNIADTERVWKARQTLPITTGKNSPGRRRGGNVTHPGGAR